MCYLSNGHSSLDSNHKFLVWEKIWYGAGAVYDCRRWGWNEVIIRPARKRDKLIYVPLGRPHRSGDKLGTGEFTLIFTNFSRDMIPVLLTHTPTTFQDY